MKSFTEKLQNWFSAVAFAEEGEHDTALKMVGMTRIPAVEGAGVLQGLSKNFAAAAFAEENCPDIAREILDGPNNRRSFADIMGLKGVRVWYGTASMVDEPFLAAVGLQGVRVRFGTVKL